MHDTYSVTPHLPIGKLVNVYVKAWMALELAPLQVTYNNTYTALKSVCYCVNQKDNATITHYIYYPETKHNSK